MELKNRSAWHEYHIEDTYDAGMVLTGTEVKSLRESKASFNDAYCLIHKGEVWLKSFNIATYAFGTYANHDPVRDRKLLLNKKEIRKIEGKMKEKGHTLIPLRVWFSENGHAKIQIGLARGKKLHDKRESIRQKDSDREIKRFLKR
jgi:SsrA-binding protein